MLRLGRVATATVFRVTPMSSPRWIILLALILLAASATPALAGIGSYFSGLATQSRVIQICIVTVAIALFIMLKKFESR